MPLDEPGQLPMHLPAAFGDVAAGSMLFSPLPGILADLSKGSYVPAYLLFALFSLVQLLLIQGVYIRCSHRKAG